MLGRGAGLNAKTAVPSGATWSFTVCSVGSASRWSIKHAPASRGVKLPLEPCYRPRALA